MINAREEARLSALYRLNLLDTPPSEAFDRITRMAAMIFNLPISAVSLTDRDRQWFKSRVGVDHWSIPRLRAPCAEVAETEELVLIPDLHKDACYSQSLLAEQGIRFYAGASLTTREGYSLGALCVLGTEPREASELELESLKDLAKMVMAQIELQHAFGRVDPLSGLPNRNQFLDDLADLGRDCHGERQLAVLVDIARHEQINNGLRVMGSAYLDEVVRYAAHAISSTIGPGRTAYHVGATQFVFLASGDVDEAEYLAHLSTVLERFRTASPARFVMTTSIGVAPFTCGETVPLSVLRTAHSAAQDARSSPSMVSIYSPEIDSAHQRRFTLLQDFAEALAADDQLYLMFQPRIDLATGECIGAEALLRWRHPELGSVSPAEFIPIIEQTSLAAPMTNWVLDHALAQIAAWRTKGLNICGSLNVSAVNLQQPDFAQQVQLYLLKHRLRPECVELEVTESAVMEDVTSALTQLAALDEAGIQIAIDDFGTGYSSLAYLQRLPGSVLKIDKAFVFEMTQGEREKTLVRSMISLAHDLGYRTVAEGVETEEARAMLAELACDEAQGYLFSRPMDVAEFEEWHGRWSETSSATARAA